jgi:hypothetical protein
MNFNINDLKREMLAENQRSRLLTERIFSLMDKLTDKLNILGHDFDIDKNTISVYYNAHCAEFHINIEKQDLICQVVGIGVDDNGNYKEYMYYITDNEGSFFKNRTNAFSNESETLMFIIDGIGSN